MTTAGKPLRAVLAGCGKMGRHQARILQESPLFDLTAVADIDGERARAVAELTGAAAYEDSALMLREQQPDTVSICTANDTHAQLAQLAAEFGVGGVYCEKPMATNLGDARAMVEVCRDRGTVLVINHQRRLGQDLRRAREWIDKGVIGPLQRIVAACAGDLLSDGTHAIDSTLYLAGDVEVEWVAGWVQRQTPSVRYGHIVETGAWALLHLRSGVEIELRTGDMRPPHLPYQTYEVVGARGRLWRVGDQMHPNLFHLSPDGGAPVTDLEGPVDDAVRSTLESGLWRVVDTPPRQASKSVAESYRLFAHSIATGEPHPLCGEFALRGFEALMAVFESARQRRQVALPLQETRHPLALLEGEGAHGAAS